MSEHKRYTEQEIREAAEGLVDSCVADNISILVGHGNLKAVKGDRIVSMLRQAADAEEENAKLKARLERRLQMASENETVESVIANARKEIDYGDGVLLHLTGKRANEILDRIGSAWRREKAELVECLKEAVHNQCYECRYKDVDGGCIGCCYKKWNDALRSANATVADGGES